MEDKVRKALAEYNLTEDDLTKEELEELKEEIKAKEQGACILDGVFSNVSLFYRKAKKKEQNNNEKN